MGDAIEDARRKLDAQSQTKVEQVDQQIERVDLMLRQGQAKERALESLSERLTHLEQQIGELAPAAPMYVKEDPARRNSTKKDAEPPTEDEAMVSMWRHQCLSLVAFRLGLKLEQNRHLPFPALALAVFPRRRLRVLTSPHLLMDLQEFLL